MQTSTPRFELGCPSRSASIVWAVLILLLQTANVWAQIGPRGVRPQPLGAGHSTVKGRVVYKDNLAP
jgi:hypothetical protein